MSKSKGLQEDWILRNLLKKYSANSIKMYVLSTHYRSPLEFSADKMSEAKRSLGRISNFLRNARFLISDDGKNNREIKKNTVAEEILSAVNKFKSDFNGSMEDDFNSARAIGNLFDLIKEVNTVIQSPDFKNSIDTRKSLRLCHDVIIEYSKIFGFNLAQEIEDVTRSDGDNKAVDKNIIEELISQRDNARREKDFDKADEIRAKLEGMGILLEDRKEGTIWKRVE
jgi:cysteinyl-tRNA synthetase